MLPARASLPASVALALLLASLAGVARASAARIHVPAVAVAGKVVELSWEGLPAGCEEVEVVLSLDGGRSFHLRVTPELDGLAESFRWSVPDLPTEEARLLLRFGGEEGEQVGAVSRTFRIVHAPVPQPGTEGFLEGDAWTGPARAAGRVGAIRDPRAPAFAEAAEGAPAEGPLPGLAVPRQPPARAAGADTPPPDPPAEPRDGSAPARVPLRI